MNIHVNGDAVQVDDGTTIVDLLGHLGFPERGIAVAVDHTLVPKSDWDITISDGALVDVVAAVQGG